MDLDSMKYAELRSLAKDVGIKASKLKADKLLRILKEHFQHQQMQDAALPVEQGHKTNMFAQDDINSTLEDGSSSQDDELSLKPPSQEFVTKRRGRGQLNKRKELGNEQPDSSAGATFTQSENVEEAEDSVSQRSAKRRRVSANSSEVAAPGEQETETQHKEPAPVVMLDKGEGPKVVKSIGRIPRHEGLLKRTTLKPTTPNFKKLHEAHFKKMESIDSYVERRTKQVDLFKNSVKELKSSNSSRASLFSPASQKPAVDKRRVTQLSASKPATEKSRVTQLSASKPAGDKRRQTQGSAKKDTVVPFRPTILSTRRINVRFTEVTLDNEHKRSMVKTPARMSHRVELSTPGKEARVGETSVLSSTKMPAFVFNANSSVLSNTPGTNKKANFDLKASLSKPLPYKPHRGKLKPFGLTKENTSHQTVADQSQTVSTHQNYKQHQVQTREDRRTNLMEGRKQKKEKMLGARRGLVLT
ncbi:hypothetical protein UPYG_G00227450 [Umbra pygmaea]|uniref:Nucleolar and spindle-associated protein 1 n=1 Tax=Umbra pygmaea TaxID=75934 RepID=A0ABD0WCQ3_UMBPY